MMMFSVINFYSTWFNFIYVSIHRFLRFFNFLSKMSVSKEVKAAERVQIAQFISSQTPETTVNFLHCDFVVKIINYLVTITKRNYCRLLWNYKLKLNTW